MKIKLTKKNLYDYLLYVSVIAAGIILDQLTKLLAVEFLKGKPGIRIFGDFLKLNYVENRGMAFGMMQNSRWIFMTVSSVAIIAMLAYLFFVKNQPKLYTVSVAVIASGGIGNMIDRIFLGYVIDFVDVKYFAVFNGADSLVCIGAGFLILAMVLDIIKESKRLKEEKENGRSEK